MTAPAATMAGVGGVEGLNLRESVGAGEQKTARAQESRPGAATAAVAVPPLAAASKSPPAPQSQPRED